MVRACKTEENDWEKLHRLPSDLTTETWQATMRSGMKAFGIDQEMVMDRSGERSHGKDPVQPSERYMESRLRTEDEV